MTATGLDQSTPDWAPLEAALPTTDAVGDFMWMGRAQLGGQTIEQYKHRDTRRYVHLDHKGGAWHVQYLAGGPVATPLASFEDAYKAAAGAFAHPLSQ